MSIAIQIASLVLTLLWLAMLGRIVFSFVFQFAHEWRPRGLVALAIESLYSATDPIIKPLRKVIRPISIGMFRFDLAFMIAFFGIVAAQYYLQALAIRTG